MGPEADYRPPPMALESPTLVIPDTFSMVTVKDVALTMDCGQGQPHHVEVQKIYCFIELFCAIM